jgi:nicotinamide-nucleotide amidase
MAEGVLAHSHADISVSVTGIAGPGGGSPEKPVGLVHMASARRGRETVHEEHRFEGNRDTVRQQAAAAALRLMLLNTKED